MRCTVSFFIIISSLLFFEGGRGKLCRSVFVDLNGGQRGGETFCVLRHGGQRLLDPWVHPLFEGKVIVFKRCF